MTRVITSQQELDTLQGILDQQYKSHEIDATLYASLSEDVQLMRRRVKS